MNRPKLPPGMVRLKVGEKRPKIYYWFAGNKEWRRGTFPGGVVGPWDALSCAPKSKAGKEK